jgi:hypothetical protein
MTRTDEHTRQRDPTCPQAFADIMSRRIVARTRGQACCRLRCGATDLILEESSGRQPGGGVWRCSWPGSKTLRQDP